MFWLVLGFRKSLGQWYIKILLEIQEKTGSNRVEDVETDVFSTCATYISVLHFCQFYLDV
jgi:hypothetical protein